MNDRAESIFVHHSESILLIDPYRDEILEANPAESVFREFERENQLILRAAGEGIYGVDANGRTTFVNPAAERMLGWKAEDLIGKDIHSTIHHTREDGSP